MRLRISILCSVIVLLFGCGGGPHDPAQNDTLDAAHTSPVRDSLHTKADSSEDIVIIPSEISIDLFKKRNISLPGPFSADSAFKKLFPGHYYKLTPPYSDGADTVTLVAWSAHKAQQHSFAGWPEEGDALFPLKDSNETRLKECIPFVDDNGHKNVLMSFSTTEFTTELLPTGRFTCACFGLALFMEENNSWNLKTFSPALGCYGAFQTIPAINLLKFGRNNYGCYIDNTNGGAGGPFYTDSYVFGIVNGDFKPILEREGTGRIYDGKSEWKSQFKPQSAAADGFSELQVITKGDYHSKKNFDDAEDDTANTPTAIKGVIRSKEHFNFTIVSHYAFENGAYVFKSQELDMTPGKGE